MSTYTTNSGRAFEACTMVKIPLPVATTGTLRKSFTSKTLPMTTAARRERADWHGYLKVTGVVRITGLNYLVVKSWRGETFLVNRYGTVAEARATENGWTVGDWIAYPTRGQCYGDGMAMLAQYTVEH